MVYDTCSIVKEELSSQRDVGFESIKESVTDARAANGVYDAESDTSQVRNTHIHFHVHVYTYMYIIYC